MKIEIKLISKEIITPSSPTPNNVSNYNLSFLDQQFPSILVPLTLFFKANVNQSNTELSIRLKKSLSKTLSLYYPLAGRVVDNTYVECNDQGAVYVEAQAECTLLDVINEPIPIELDKLNPKNLADVHPGFCIFVQTTFFKCGGLAIGLAITHKVCDGWSFSLFTNSWAAISRGDDDQKNQIKSPIFQGAKIFPPRSDVSEFGIGGKMISKEDIITKRFIFTASKIDSLRDKYTNTYRATRIEALSAFIWTRFMVSTTGRTKLDDLQKISILVHIVNIRKRVVPPLSDESFGNLIRPAIAVISHGGHEQEAISGVGVAQKLREAIHGVGGSEYVNSINSNNDKPSSGGGGGEEAVVVPMVFMFTSLCRFRLYEADFGWGKPAWIAFCNNNNTAKNVVGFMDSPNEGSIEAWIYLEKEDMAMFIADEEILAYATTN